MKFLIYSALFLMLACAENSEETITSENESDETVEQVVESNEEIVEETSSRKYTEYHENGALKIEGMNDENGLRTGIWTSYYPNGTKWSESHYIKGLKEGHSVTFYENGNTRYIGEYKNDKQHGEWLFYDEEGNETDKKVFE